MFIAVMTKGGGRIRGEKEGKDYPREDDHNFSVEEGSKWRMRRPLR